MIIESGSCAIKEIFKGKIKGHNRKDNPVPSCIMMGGHFRSVLWVAQATDRPEVTSRHVVWLRGIVLSNGWVSLVWIKQVHKMVKVTSCLRRGLRVS